MSAPPRHSLPGYAGRLPPGLIRVCVLSIALLTLPGGSVAHGAGIRSETILIDSPVPGLKLALHHEFVNARPTSRRPRVIVLFAEGSAVPTSGNAGFKINGSSWMDNLAVNGFDVWSLDYLGYGESGRYPDSEADIPPGRASACAAQLERAARFILKRQRAHRLSVIGDSFGSLVAGIYATSAPQLLDKLVLFAPTTPAPRRHRIGLIDKVNHILDTGNNVYVRGDGGFCLCVAAYRWVYRRARPPAISTPGGTIARRTVTGSFLTPVHRGSRLGVRACRLTWWSK